MKVYLDNCCFNCPYDGQTQIRILLETQAKLYVLDLVKKKKDENMAQISRKVGRADGRNDFSDTL